MLYSETLQTLYGPPGLLGSVDADSDPAYTDEYPDPAFHFNADTDRASKNYSDPCGSGSATLVGTGTHPGRGKYCSFSLL